ncbi:MAG TPA: peptidase U32 family protein, partial [Paludibacter sp.]|nr:peptidase U32 family protein [Paludibacter sp.]
MIIELLSPAKNLECGLAAINHGADAVYIGASQFGARSAAGNSMEDIETLVNYAHRFRSKIFVALNTILTDDQLPEAEKLIHQIYNAGADALIVQDMGILKMNLPPIALHASTQTDNRTVEKVRFLQDVGFSRVVLARELTLKQITEISSSTNVELEAFVHGALCVSYSGQCYMSQAMCGRSANRGQCAQYCRLPYNLTDADENILVKNKHLLSLKDLDLSDSLEEMMHAGIMSFKIEGRLKDADYVKNITSFYRKKIDAILESSDKFQKSSLGKTTFFFEPNPEKSFRRGNTDYFLHGRHNEIIQPNTPKSMGEPIGKVKEIGEYYFT